LDDGAAALWSEPIDTGLALAAITVYDHDTGAWQVFRSKPVGTQAGYQVGTVGASNLVVECFAWDRWPTQ
jgi:hypothetical protein